MQLKVVSFNIRYGTADDGENAWPHRKEACLEAIRAHAPDVLCVQEALHFQVEEILDAFPQYESVGVGRDDGLAAGEFAPIFYRSDSLKVKGSGTFWFSSQPDTPGSKHLECFHPRICTWADFGGFGAYNLHLDNESALARVRSVEQLLKTTSSKPTIVAGDFNADEGDACIEGMRRAGFRDSYRLIHPDGPAPTYHGFGVSTQKDKIDYIWVDSGWTVMDALIDGSQFGGQWPSDHFVVVSHLYAVE